MTILQAAILGIVQGLTEFLPISSSGHQVLLQHWFGLNQDMLTFDIAVQWGTLIAVFAFFAQDIRKVILQSAQFLIQRPKGPARDEFFMSHPHALISGLIILSSMVTLFTGIFFKELFEFTFRSVFAVGLAWLIMGTLLVFSNRIKSVEAERELAQMHHLDAFLIGLAQGLALIPGISGLGAMILMGRRCGLNPNDAVRYAFLLGIPLTLGAGLYKLNEALPFVLEQPQIYGTGFLCAMVVSFFSIRIVFQLLERGKFYFFGIYCFAIGLFAIASQFLKS